MSAPQTQRRGFSSTLARETKALKIRKILSEFGRPITGDTRILDIGTGSGEVAQRLAQESSLVAIDLVDQRTCDRGYSFVRADTRLP